MISDVWLSSPLWGALNLAGMLLGQDLQGDARVCGTPMVPGCGDSMPGSLRRDEQGSPGSATLLCATSCNPCSKACAPTAAPCSAADGLALILAPCVAKESWPGVSAPSGWPCPCGRSPSKTAACAGIHSSDHGDAAGRPCPELD